MTNLPDGVKRLLEKALVGELTVVNSKGEPVTHPLIPLWDGEKIYMTSAVIFSKKLDNIKANPKVAVSLSNSTAMAGLPDRATIQGDARIIEDDPHTTWEQVLPLWREKEPAIDFFLGKRVALPLFFERSIIEITPRRVLFWPGGETEGAPQVTEVVGAA
ncbi:MAG: pyridoxamine 5'-phosphate oxidase family protein [Dehalococcoidia bacterium]